MKDGTAMVGEVSTHFFYFKAVLATSSVSENLGKPPYRVSYFLILLSLRYDHVHPRTTYLWLMVSGHRGDVSAAASDRLLWSRDGI